MAGITSTQTVAKLKQNLCKQNSDFKLFVAEAIRRIAAEFKIPVEILTSKYAEQSVKGVEI